MFAHPAAGTESYTAFRTRLLLDTILPTFVIPPLLCAALLRILSTNFGTITVLEHTFTIFLAYLFSVPSSLFVRVQIRRRKQRLEAQRMGAREVPRIRGKWPGTLDVLVGFIKSPQRGYLLDPPKDIMTAMSSNTVNTNILWADQVCRCISILANI
jgi:hypothetical protein